MKPNVGMSYAYAALVNTYTPGTGITYLAPFKVSEARGATVQWESSDGEFYGDDVLLDQDVDIVAYTIDFETAGLKSADRAKILGETVLAESAGYRVKGGGSPDVGFAYIRTMREDVEGVVTERYEAWFFYKMKFKLNSEESRTKEKNLEWRVPTLNGKGGAINLGSGSEVTFADHQDFSSLSAAQAWITNTKFGVAVQSGGGGNGSVT